MKTALVLALLAVSVAAKPASPYGDRMRAAETIVSNWLVDLKGKSQKDIEGTFGAPLERDTWDYEGKAYPLLRYITPTKGKLNLYFMDDKVLTVSYQLLP